MNDRKIILNRIRCVHCNDIITSYSVHDDNTCKCGKISVDGGTAYLKRGFEKDSDYEDLSIHDDAPFEIIRNNFHWGTTGKSGNENLRWVTISEMTTSHLNNLLRNPKQGALWIRKLFIIEFEYRKKNKIFIED